MPEEENIPTTDYIATTGNWEFIPPPEEMPHRAVTADAVNEQVRQLMQERAIPTPIAPHPDTAGIKLTAEVLLGRSLLDLLRAAPNNATVRTMLSKHCRRTIPVELDSVDRIIEWIEANVTLPPPVLDDRPADRPTIRTRLGNARAVAEPADDTVITMDAFRRGTASGRCRYDESWRQSMAVKLTRLQFEEFVAQAESFDALMENLQSHADSECEECAETHEDRDYEEHDNDEWECEESGLNNLESCADVVTQLLVEIRNRIEDGDDREAFEDKFGL